MKTHPPCEVCGFPTNRLMEQPLEAHSYLVICSGPEEHQHMICPEAINVRFTNTHYEAGERERPELQVVDMKYRPPTTVYFMMADMPVGSVLTLFDNREWVRTWTRLPDTTTKEPTQ